MSTIAAVLTALVLMASQEDAPGTLLTPATSKETASATTPTVEWKEGIAIPVRIPLSAPGRECMTTLAFPENSIETAITGWGDGEITAVQKRGLLFLRLAKKSEGQLNVIGGSGTHYLFYLKAVDSSDPESYDTYLKIRKKDEPAKGDAVPKRQAHRPGAAVELIQAMRLGLHPENVKILRAKRELAYESPVLEVRLLYVYDADSYRGMVYEVKNLSSERQAVDASRFRGKGSALVLTALRENVLLPGASTRLYALAWKD